MSAKRMVQVTVDAELADRVEALGAEASSVVEAALREVLSKRGPKVASKEIAEAVEAHNRYIDRNGVWSEAYREW